MLERGRRVREFFQQPQYKPLPVPDQVAVLLAAGEGLLNVIPAERIAEAERAIRNAIATELPAVCQRMESGAKLTAEDREDLRRLIGSTVKERSEEHTSELQSLMRISYAVFCLKKKKKKQKQEE